MTAPFYGYLPFSARVWFAAHQLASKVGAPPSLRRLLRLGVTGVYKSPQMSLRLRPDCWDAWTAHPGHEPETHAWIASTFKGGEMIDVGAFCGSFCLRYASAFDRITAFEASARNYAALKQNTELSGAANVTPVHSAVSDCEGDVRLYLATPDTNSLIGSGEFETVPAVTLDATPRLEEVAFVKIDVEGAELSVLRGASGLLALRRATILAEANDERHATELSAFMASRGYRQDRVLDGRNYVFVPA